MATAKIDKEAVKQDLLAGKKSGELGRKYKCSPQYIRLIAKDLKQLPKSPRGRKPKAPVQDERLKELTVKDLDDIGLTMYERALDYPNLQRKIQSLENRNASLEHTNKELEKENKELREKELKLNLIKQRQRESVYGE